jgi:uncharacterized membrane protein
VALDIESEIEIGAPRERVSAFAADLDNTSAWYGNIESVEWQTPRPTAQGSRVAFVARFLGRRLAYIYEVVELVPGERLVMSTQEGPFPMETTYEWRDAPGGGTTMRLRNRGRPSGFPRLLAPFMSGAVRRANRKDLQRLKVLVEARASGRSPGGQ